MPFVRLSVVKQRKYLSVFAASKGEENGAMQGRVSNEHHNIEKKQAIPGRLMDNYSTCQDFKFRTAK